VDESLFKGGAFFLAYDQTPDRCNSEHWHNSQSGNIDCEFIWDNESADQGGLKESICILALGTFNDVLILDEKFTLKPVSNAPKETKSK